MGVGGEGGSGAAGFILQFLLSQNSAVLTKDAVVTGWGRATALRRFCVAARIRLSFGCPDTKFSSV